MEVQGGRTSTVLQEDEEEAGLYIVKYIPEEVGHTAIHVFWNNTEIPGSPFQARIIDPKQVKLQGGWDGERDVLKGFVEMERDVERTLCFDTRMAGPGKMSMKVDTKLAKIDIKEASGVCSMNIIIHKTGSHKFSIRFGGVQIFKGIIKVKNSDVNFHVSWIVIGKLLGNRFVNQCYFLIHFVSGTKDQGIPLINIIEHFHDVNINIKSGEERDNWRLVNIRSSG